MVNEGECVYVTVWVLCTCVRVSLCVSCVTSYVWWLRHDGRFCHFIWYQRAFLDLQNNSNTPHFTQPPLRVGLAVF